VYVVKRRSSASSVYSRAVNFVRLKEHGRAHRSSTTGSAKRPPRRESAALSAAMRAGEVLTDSSPGSSAHRRAPRRRGLEGYRRSTVHPWAVGRPPIEAHDAMGKCRDDKGVVQCGSTGTRPVAEEELDAARGRREVSILLLLALSCSFHRAQRFLRTFRMPPADSGALKKIPVRLATHPKVPRSHLPRCVPDVVVASTCQCSRMARRAGLGRGERVVAVRQNGLAYQFLGPLADSRGDGNPQM